MSQGRTKAMEQRRKTWERIRPTILAYIGANNMTGADMGRLCGKKSHTAARWFHPEDPAAPSQADMDTMLSVVEGEDNG